MPEDAIRTEGLTRYFGARCVVSDLNLAVPKGVIFGLLGRNGCGKTTTLRMILGLLEPTRGSARILGYSSDRIPAEVRARIGYLTESHPATGWMSLRECGKFQAAFYPTWNEDIFQAVLKHFALEPRRKARDLSRGERAGLCLALTLSPDPELLILDDPALGLDPVARRSLLESMLYVTRREGRTILFSSHVLSDVERVADQIAILDRGVLRATCSLEVFRSRVRRLVLRFGTSPPSLPDIPGLLHCHRTEREVALTIANLTPDIQKSLEALPSVQITTTPLDLEEAFISYVGERGERTFFLQGMKESS
jgi:ABC-2 type transport system ATP-binding protein